MKWSLFIVEVPAALNFLNPVVIIDEVEAVIWHEAFYKSILKAICASICLCISP